MTTYRITVALAEDAHGHMTCTADFYNGPTLVPVANLRLHPAVLTVDADSLDAALNYAFEAGNIGVDGWAAGYRAAGCRSISVGDVLFVHIEGSGVVARQVLPFGFGTVSYACAVAIVGDEAGRRALIGPVAEVTA
jgi:hypothetical protein